MEAHCRLYLLLFDGGTPPHVHSCYAQDVCTLYVFGCLGVLGLVCGLGGECIVWGVGCMCVFADLFLGKYVWDHVRLCLYVSVRAVKCVRCVCLNLFIFWHVFWEYV